MQTVLVLLLVHVSLDQLLPDQLDPDQLEPDQLLPDQLLPDQLLPDQLLPDQLLPDHELPDQELPDQLLPDQVLPLQAVIMAGGSGNRLRPLTEETPKPMLTVGDRPLMELMIEQLRQVGIRRVHRHELGEPAGPGRNKPSPSGRTGPASEHPGPTRQPLTWPGPGSGPPNRGR